MIEVLDSIKAGALLNALKLDNFSTALSHSRHFDQTDEAKAMVTDMLEQIHRHRRRNAKAAADGKGLNDDDDYDDDDESEAVPINRYKSRPSVVEMDIESEDVMDNMLKCLAEYQLAHREDIRELLTEIIGGIKESSW